MILAPTGAWLPEFVGDLPAAPTPEASAWGGHLARVFGRTALAVLHYGSRAQGRPSSPDSPFDFFVIVTGYSEAYAAIRAAGLSSPTIRANLLARVLPPNGMKVVAPALGGPAAKCLIISWKHFSRECSPHARDHFVMARMIQLILPLWFRDPAAARTIGESIGTAREHTARWMPVFLPARFTLDQYCRGLIAVSFMSEVRAEPPAHVDVLLSAQREPLRRIYRPLLDRLADEGTLVRDGDSYRQAGLPGPIQRFRVSHYFRWSKARTTLRLLKHPLLYDDWLEYLLGKIERHTGQRIVLTKREQRHPLVYLWPRALRWIRHRPQQGG